MYKKIIIMFFSAFLSFFSVVASSSPATGNTLTSLVRGNVPVAISLNIGMPPMTGCQSIKNQPKIDCFIHRLGIAPFAQTEATVIGNDPNGYSIKNYKTMSISNLRYTQFHVNGYFSSVSPVYTFTRFGMHQPFLSVSGISKSGYDYKPYTYTAVEFLLLCQNIITNIDFSTSLKKVINDVFKPAQTTVWQYFSQDYSVFNAAVSNDLVAYLQGNGFYKYSCSAGNFLGGPVPSVHTKTAGMTEFQNYVLDACGVYKNSVYLCNNYDVTPALQVDPQVALGTNSSNQSIQLTQVSFNTAIAGTKLQISDYFNGTGTDALVYLPLHLSDPGTTYSGADLVN
jgi:hypothetical protein